MAAGEYSFREVNDGVRILRLRMLWSRQSVTALGKAPLMSRNSTETTLPAPGVLDRGLKEVQGVSCGPPRSTSEVCSRK